MPAAKTKARGKPVAKTARVPKTKPPKTESAETKGSVARKATKNGYDPVAPARVQDILNRLDQHYPNVTCALHHSNAWELLIATILSAQCTDVMVNKVTPILFQKYPTPQAMAAATPEELEPILRPTGFYRNKAKSVVGASKGILENFGGQVPDEMDKILTLPGVARKTANVVLGTWYKKAVGVVVDTHVHRISRRLELTEADDPKNIEQDLMKVIPQARWIDYSHQIIHHGRALCIARRPKCAECPLENLCHAADKTWSTVEIHKSATP
ncbi:MAG TPA: endonuclease III [Candidatus Angelobacter sp.]|jgi:endonuclease-3